MVSYAKCRADFEYLESVAELDEQVDLDARRLELMENPTKQTAAEIDDVSVPQPVQPTPASRSWYKCSSDSLGSCPTAHIQRVEP